MKYERLTTKGKDGNWQVWEDDFSHPFEALQTAIDKLAELEDKIENGTLVEVLCKAGDKVYQFDNGGKIYESEKVKEIKTYFEESSKIGGALLYKENDELKTIYFADILTLINELESENEKLANLLETERIVAKQRSSKLEKAEHDRDRYKKRIAELDDLVAEIYVAVENARKETKEAEEYVKREISKLFTSFAERVKMEFYYHFDELIPSIMSDKIDKILKELIGE